MRTLVVGTSDLGDASIGRDYEDRRQIALEGSIQPRETLDIQHVYLKQQYTDNTERPNKNRANILPENSRS